eukprot:TRINITY_DN8978_c0_g1_i1.p1 TRINITY_DN8978_c0_g1~~TRINITY_DN8978_c0_g1_i1.p1  ORF type:complete len:251 (+),score=51.88 TRINITY_DN8978_c0_g1_i1:63-815(+)
MSGLKAIVVIPARYASTRLPGKPLCDIMGKPMIEHTYRSCQKAKLIERIVVATDDERIKDAVIRFGGEVVMTRPECPTGSDRVKEAMEIIGNDYDVVVNVQGDEPCIDPDHIDAVTKVLTDDPSASMGTLATRLTSEEDGHNRNIVKCIVNANKDAIYFSRSLIPHSKSGKFDPDYPYLRHLGIYSFRPQFLKDYVHLTHRNLEMQEELEQLRAIESGHKIKVDVVGNAMPGVDTQEGLDLIREHIKMKR